MFGIIRACLTIGLFVASVAPAAAIGANCSRAWVCVDLVDSGAEVSVFARNLRQFPVTVSFALRGRGLPSAARQPVTQTVPGGQRIRLQRFVDPGSDYRYSYDWTVGEFDAQHNDEYVYRLPYAAGTSYRVLQGYGSRFSHTGFEQYTVDFDMPEGAAVHAARDGTVAMVEESNDIGCWENWCARHANYVVILHDDGTTGEYYHLQKHGVLVEEGESVLRGQLIARSGNTGHTTMPHLHFGVYRAAEWGRTRSLPVRFETTRGTIAMPRAGSRYEVPETR